MAPRTSPDWHLYAKNVDGTSFSTREIMVLLILSSSSAVRPGAESHLLPPVRRQYVGRGMRV